MTFKLPRSLSLPRALVVLLGLCIAYVGFEETRLRIRCWSPRELPLEAVKEAAADGPVWTVLEVAVPDIDTISVTTDTGNSQGAWVPLLASPGERAVAAVLAAESSSDLVRLRDRKVPARVEVLAYPPRAAERSAMAASLGTLGLRAAPGLVVLDLDRRPASLLAGLFYLAIGIGLAAASVLGVKLPLPRFLRWPAIASVAEEPPHVLPTLESSPLPEEVKVDVHHMLEEAWSGVKSSG